MKISAFFMCDDFQSDTNWLKSKAIKISLREISFGCEQFNCKYNL